MPHAFLREGPVVPEVTTPTFSPDYKNNSVFSLIGTLSPINPHLFLVTPSFKCFLTRWSPKNPNYSFLLLEIVQANIASKGEIFSSSSWPYKQRPASSLSESLAPRPTGTAIYSLVELSLTVQIFSINASMSELITETSNPSSPVYPHLDTIIGLF